MKYCQLDRITLLHPGEKLCGERTLRAQEEYLSDHFPRFPVMPGVMMLEALHQAAVWLVRVSDRFQHPLVLLKEAKAVKFGDFLSPGETLNVEAEIVKVEGLVTSIKATAKKGDKITVSARLILESCTSGDSDELATDADLKWLACVQFRRLFGENPAVAALSLPFQPNSLSPVPKLF